MSVPVEVRELEDQIEQFGTTPYLLTVDDYGRPHAVAVRVSWVGGGLVCQGGQRTLAHAEARPAVTMLWPPFEEGGYSLIVDGEATVADGKVALRPSSAVLHRPIGVGADGEPGSECVHVACG